MPKLNQQAQDLANDAEEWRPSSGGGLAPEGFYLCTVTASDFTQKSNAGNDKIHWEFTVVHPKGEPENKKYAGKVCWYDVATSGFKDERAAKLQAGKYKAVLSAVGLTLDSDSSEFLGEPILVYLGQEEAQRGNMAGKMVNVVSGVAPAEGEIAKTGAAPSSGTAAPVGAGDAWS